MIARYHGHCLCSDEETAAEDMALQQEWNVFIDNVKMFVLALPRVDLSAASNAVAQWLVGDFQPHGDLAECPSALEIKRILGHSICSHVEQELSHLFAGSVALVDCLRNHNLNYKGKAADALDTFDFKAASSLAERLKNGSYIELLELNDFKELRISSGPGGSSFLRLSYPIAFLAIQVSQALRTLMEWQTSLRNAKGLKDSAQAIIELMKLGDFSKQMQTHVAAASRDVAAVRSVKLRDEHAWLPKLLQDTASSMAERLA